MVFFAGGFFATDGPGPQIIVAIAVLGGVLSLIKLIPKMLRLISKSVQTFEGFVGTPERPGVLDTLELNNKALKATHEAIERTNDRLAKVEQQLNGGGKIQPALERLEANLEVVAGKADEAVIAAGLAVNEAKVGRKVLSEAHDRNVADLAETKGLLAELAERQHEQAEVATVQRGLIEQSITDSATHILSELTRRTEAYSKRLVERGGPDLTDEIPGLVQPHTHEVSTSHPVEDSDETP